MESIWVVKELIIMKSKKLRIDYKQKIKDVADKYNLTLAEARYLREVKR